MSDLRKGIYLLPNLLTTASLFCGFYAILTALKISDEGGQNFSRCALFIILAAIFDGMDGRVARKIQSSSRFGVELDSLCDLVSFGVAPALTIYTWALRDFGRVGWAAAFLYLACGAFRLARFNVQVQSVERKFFQGLPIPMAAMMVCSSILIWEGKPIQNESMFFAGDIQGILLAMTYLLAGLMVSNIPYRSFKTLQLTQKMPFYSLILVAIGFMIWATVKWWFFFVLGGTYILSGPLEKYVFGPPVKALRKVKEKRGQERRAEDSDRENVHPIRHP